MVVILKAVCDCYIFSYLGLLCLQLFYGCFIYSCLCVGSRDHLRYSVQQSGSTIPDPDRQGPILVLRSVRGGSNFRHHHLHPVGHQHSEETHHLDFVLKITLRLSIIILTSGAL